MQLPKTLIGLPKSKYLELLHLEEKKTKQFTTLILSLFAISVLGIFAINPTLSTIAQLQRQLEDNEFVDEKLSEKINNLNSLKQRYDSIESDLSLVLLAVPKSAEASYLLGQIQALATSSNTSIVRLQTFQVELTEPKMQPKGNKLQFSTVGFSLGIEGSNDELAAFVDSLVNFERIITIDSLSYSESTQTQKTQLNIRGKAYFKKQQ